MSTILLIGSVSWDEVVHLYAPLQPGGHNGGRTAGRRIGGGAANSAMALARAGDRARVLSAVGPQSEGAMLVAELTRLGVDVELIHRHAEETTRSLVLIDPYGERSVVNLARAAVPIPPGLPKIAADCCYVRSADVALIAAVAQRASSGTVVAHIPPVSPGFRHAQVLVGSAADLDDAFLADPFIAGRRVAGAALGWTVVTYGPGGAVAYGEGTVLEQPAPLVQVEDSTGAGDVFAAGLVHALASGAPMRAALRKAVSWGAASVAYQGTVPPPDFVAKANALLEPTGRVEEGSGENARW